MKNKNNKTVSVALTACAFSIALVGCGEVSANTGAVIDENDLSTKTYTTSSQVDFSSTPTMMTQPTASNHISVYYDLDSYIQYLDSLNHNINYKEVLYNCDKYTSRECELAAYLNLKQYGYSISEVLKELNNILVYSQIPSCCTNEEFESLVGKLIPTLDYQYNPFTCYRALAQEIHKLSCGLIHQEGLGIYTCDNLKKDYLSKGEIEYYLDVFFCDDIAYQKIKFQMYQNPTLTIDAFLFELNNLIQAQYEPSCYPENLWYQSFGLLVSTLNENESLYDTYIDLAIAVHNLMHPEELLSKNDLEIYTSSELKRVKS